VRTALVNDIARSLGRSTSSFYFAEDTFEMVSTSVTRVYFFVTGQNYAERRAVRHSYWFSFFFFFFTLFGFFLFFLQLLVDFELRRGNQQAWALYTERLFAEQCRTVEGTLRSSATGTQASVAVAVMAAVVALAGSFWRA
jgi:hypothetical protein